MAEFPALPLFTDAYLGDTTHLTTQEHGAYLLLLMVSWRTPGCRLPDDDAILARYTKMTLDKWRKVRPILASFFKIADGFWTQGRLQDELQHLQSRREQQREAGHASAVAKALKRKAREAANATDPLKRSGKEQATPIPRPSSVSKDTGGEPPEVDPKKVLFDAGVALLTGAGKKDGQARGIIGKWRKEHGDPDTLAAIVAAGDKSLSDPVSWIEARLRQSVAAEDEERAARERLFARYERECPGPNDLKARH